MSKIFKNNMIQQLTESVQTRSANTEGKRLVEKWSKTGLLEGLKGKFKKFQLATLLENQAKEILREASSMAAGDVEGFASNAFPVVRRTLGDPIAEQFVSVQPLSMPNGLIFFLDFTYGNDKDYAGAVSGESVYGGGKVAKGIATGISLDGENAEKGFYGLNNGFSSPSATLNLTAATTLTGDNQLASSTWASGTTYAAKLGTSITDDLDRGKVQHDPDILNDGTYYYKLFSVQLSAANWAKLNLDNLITIDLSGSTLNGATVVRRLTTIKSRSSYQLDMVLRNSSDSWPADGDTVAYNYAHKDAFTTGGSLGSVVGTQDWWLEALNDNTQDIPEIDIKLDSISVEAVSKKLRTKWTPEINQDLEAYHNMDVEQELTAIMSEQVEMEIDREILVDLIKGATAAKYFWSRQPGKFVNKTTGQPIDQSPGSVSGYPDFTGNVSEWYQTLVETINDASAQIHRKVLRGGANFIVCSPEVANVLEMTNGFRASNLTHDVDKGSIGLYNSGSVSKKWDVWVDAKFPRQLILLGRKGSSFLESGYVYCPYIPLMMFPLVYNPETFHPNKGLMTRYAKKMVRSDMYALVWVQDLLGGSSYE